MKKFQPEQMLELFRQNFDGETIEKIKNSIQKSVEKATSLHGLINELNQIEYIQCIEPADNDLDNEDFVPSYISDEPDSCDFMIYQCYAELDKSRLNTNSEYVEICFYVVWNDVKKHGWIDAATLGVSYNPQDYAEPICFFDLSTYEPIRWCNDTNID